MEKNDYSSKYALLFVFSLLSKVCNGFKKENVPLEETKKRSYIGNGLRRVRVEIGKSQEKLAEDSKLGPRTIQKLEANASSPTLDTIISIANAFDMEHWEFLKNIKDEIIYK
jgi:DNA-binding XRE family transcriptional regulator